MSHPGITEATSFHVRTCHDGTATSSPTNRPSVSPSRRQLLTHQPSMSRLQFEHVDLPVPPESPHRIRTTTPCGQRRHAKIGCVGWGTMTDAGSPSFFQYNDEYHKRPVFTNPQNVSENSDRIFLGLHGQTMNAHQAASGARPMTRQTMRRT